MRWKHLLSLCFRTQKGNMSNNCFLSAGMARDLPRNAGCCTRDEFLWLDTFTKAYKCFTALGFMVCVLSKRVCQQTMQHIPREQGKQLSSLAPSVRKASNIVGQGANCSICCFGSLGGKTSSVCRAVCHTARGGSAVQTGWDSEAGRSRLSMEV